jgi:hypothetical protein
MLDGEQHCDHQTRIEHAQPNCFSRELYKGVLDGSSHGVFNGKVYVHPIAQKTDGKQTNNVLLLSERAQVDTKPQLEIFADDVKCTHGATVGRIDQTALFYMKSAASTRSSRAGCSRTRSPAEVLETIEVELCARARTAAERSRNRGCDVVRGTGTGNGNRGTGVERTDRSFPRFPSQFVVGMSRRVPDSCARSSRATRHSSISTTPPPRRSRRS